VINAPSRESGSVLQRRLAQPMVTDREGWQKGGEGIFSRNAWDPD
jgi:hypothetical protein